MNAETFDYTGYYLIVLMLPSSSWVIKNILNDCWPLRIINANVLAVQNNSSDVAVYTYFPFEANRCEQVHPIIVNYFVNGSFLFTNDFFVDKFKDMQGCEMGVSVYDYDPYVIVMNRGGDVTLEGIDGITINTISTIMNFTPVIKYMGRIANAKLSLKMVRLKEK